MLQPAAYNITLTRQGEIVEFDFEPANATDIHRFGYLIPEDSRCKTCMVNSEDELYATLKPVLGSKIVPLNFNTRHQAIIQLHETAIVGYQKQVITDPRIGCPIATLWEVYLDKRIFPYWADTDWLFMFGALITEGEDAELAESIKDQLIEQANGN